jgi:NADPH:quinone reductase-like Zn-dependent oxidoreductase
VLTVVLDRFGGVDALSAREGPPPTPGPGELRIAVRAVGFNPVDCKARRGALGGVPPMVLGRDVSGVVDAVGDADTGFAVGDAVYARADAAYAESVVVPAALVARTPASLSFAEAAALPVAGLTAYRCVVDRARVGPGDAVLVAGAAGGVGSVAVPLLRHLGAAPVLATAGSDASAAYVVERLGVAPEHVLRYRAHDAGALAALARDLAGGYGVRAAFDFAGGAMKRLCFDAAAADGHVVSIVEEPAAYPLDLWDERTSPLVVRSVSYHFVQLAAALRHGPRAGWGRYGRELAELARLLDAGALPPVPAADLGPFSLAAVRRAHALLDAGGVRGKLVASVG